VIIFMVLLMLTLAGERAQAAPGDVALVSADAVGTQGNAASEEDPGTISADGRYVVFYSLATNLVPGGTTNLQVFRKDMATGEIRLVSADAAGVQGNGNSLFPSISANGRYVAFDSHATNLVVPATANEQVFWKDMVTGEIRLASATAAGAPGNHDSEFPNVSADGRYVAFDSHATNLVTPATNGLQVFRKDIMTGEIRLASSDAAGTQGNGLNERPCISSDGRYVAFFAFSTNLVTPATSFCDVFCKDLATGEIRLVSADAAGVEGNSASSWPSISDDGRYVAFESQATNLVPGGTTGTQIFRKDLATGEIRLASSDAAGTRGNALSTEASITADGRYVAFTSQATNLVTPATMGYQVFRKDLATGEVNLCSADALGAQGNALSQGASISSDGRYVAFESTSTNLLTPATTLQQVFRKELRAPHCFYFAEGYTGAGFQEYLCLGNPYGNRNSVDVTYLYKDGTTKEETYNLPGNSRSTINVNAAAGANAEVSLKCESGSPFIAERPMYFDYQGRWTGGHDAVGATSTSTSWYFAEGYTGAGFDEWICVLNPGDVPAGLTFRFQTQEEGEKVIEGFSVGPHTRQTFKANDLLAGGSYQTSLKLESDHPVVAERPMYFDYSGTGGYNWTGGSCVMGAPLLASSYYFAEGTTRAGFEEWLTIQNPNPATINVHAVYYLGAGAPVERDYPVPAGRRSTVLVNSDSVGVGTEKDVSVLLTSPSPFLAERPTYFDYQGLESWGWTGGHCVIGATSPASEWFFAEGYTGQYFEEWLCIQNPNAADAAITITYYPEAGAPIVRNHNVAANSRFTVPVNIDAGDNLSISAKLTSTQPVIVERPMYFNFQGQWNGGHDVVGYAP
jgi:Tol biopolymer transport system component